MRMCDDRLRLLRWKNTSRHDSDGTRTYDDRRGLKSDQALLREEKEEEEK